MAPHLQDEIYEASLKDPEAFWSRQAEYLYWHKKPSRALKTTTKKIAGGVSHPHWTWFPDGEISTSYNCIDRHVQAGNGDSVAIIWDSPVSGNKEKYTYKQLLHEVETLAGVLREEGVKKGDVVLIYSWNDLLYTLTVSGLILYSANDTSCTFCHPRYHPTRSYTRRRLWGFLTPITRTKNGGFKAEGYYDCFLWYRGRERSSWIPIADWKRGGEELLQAG
jgi:hypothetical protein